ncbi:P-loop NTPase [Halobacterium zhouii]|uniref:nucleotide-binding protein n=1 Tax=Halobacterium zhouii TaxID=2902624 RepID=UPI001E2D4CC8|nr:P-loop NTPase [Halobacterium zhouii]
MTGRVFAVASGKGGVGKTTTAVNLSAAATEAERSVVLVDFDLGMANLGDVLDVEASSPTLHDALAGDADALEATREAPGGFDVVLGGTDIEDFGRADPAALRDAVDALREEYEVVVVDTGGGLTHDTTVPLGVADDVVLVSTPTAAALENTGKTNDLVARLDGEVLGVVFTRVGAGGQVDTADAGDDIDVDVLGSVPEDRSVPESAAAGEPVVEHAPDSPAGEAYRELGHDLLGESVPSSFRDDDATTDEAPEPAGGANEEPAPVDSEDDESDPAAGESEEPDPVASGNDEPDPAAGGNDEPDPAAGGNDEPDPAASGNDEPDPAASGNDEPDPVASGNEEAGPVGDAIVGTLDDDGTQGSDSDQKDGGDGDRSLVSKLTGGLLG